MLARGNHEGISEVQRNEEVRSRAVAVPLREVFKGRKGSMR